MLGALSKLWWAVVLRGVLAVLFGLLLMFRPVASLATLVLLFGAFALVDGLFSVFGSIAGRKDNDHWGMMLVGGILSVIVGLLALRAPGLTTFLLLVYIAVWAILSGGTLIAFGIRVRKEITGEWAIILAGVMAAVWGLWILWNPGLGALAILWSMGLLSLLFGVAMIFAGFRVRGLAGKVLGAADQLRSAVKGA